MANPLDEYIAETKRNGTFYAPPPAGLVDAAVASAPIVAEDTATNERNARLEREATTLTADGRIVGSGTPHRTRDEWKEIAFANDERDRQFAQQRALNQDAFQQHQAAIASDMDERKYALGQSEHYLRMASERNELDNKIQSNIEAAEFLQRAAAIPFDAPDHDEQYARLAATLPRAGNNQLVQQHLQTQHAVRQNHWQAKQVIDEEQRKLGVNKKQQLVEAQAAGLITQDEMRPKANSPFHNNDGSINLDSALSIAADRAGRGEGIKSEKTDYDAALGTYKMLSAKKANEDLNEHEQLIYEHAAETMADIIKRRRGKTATGKSATDVVVQAAAPEKKPKAGAASLLGGL